MALFRRRPKSQAAKTAADRCKRESKIIKARASEKMREVKAAERLALKRLKTSCRNNARELSRYERGKDSVKPARRKASIGRRKPSTNRDFTTQKPITRAEYFGRQRGGDAKSRRTVDFYNRLYGGKK